MNRKQQTKCTVSMYKVRVSSSVSLSYTLCAILSHQSGGEFSVESPAAGSPPFWGLSLASVVSVCVHFLLFQGHCQLSLLQLRILFPHFLLMSTGPQYSFYPLALAELGIPFLQEVLYFPLSSLPLQILTVKWRPELIPLSTLLRPQTWLVCPTSLFPLPLPRVLAVHHTSGTAPCAGVTSVKETTLLSKSSQFGWGRGEQGSGGWIKAG